MIASNLFEILAVVTLGFPPLMIMFIGYLFKYVIEQNIIKNLDKEKQEIFYDYEAGITSQLAWTGGLVLLAILGPVYWIDIWEATNHIESTPYIFAMWILIIFFKWSWFKNVYIKRSEVFGWAKFHLIMDLLVSLTFALLILLTTHEDDSHWYHWLSLLLLLPPVFGWFAVYDADKYRKHESPNLPTQHQNDDKSPNIPRGLANLFGFR